ncbi:MAG: carboxypeptidase regulatory-like domain-containing protein [Acidobacteria bacterium]|nr:carboxypeptidase regulatory-like domain-containing protein [Acidobacteriota bacterium]
MRSIRSAFVLLVCLLLVIPVAAQTIEKGAITGNIYDSTGAVVPGASVKITHVGTGEQRALTSNADGRYTADALSPGEYTVEIEASGFSKVIVKEVRVAVGQRFLQDVTLKVAAAGEIVEVTADVGPIDRGETRIKTTINNTYIEELPISGRDFRDFAQLGATADTSPGLRSPVRLQGQQGEFTGLVIDGVDNRNSFFGEWFGSLETKNFTVPQDSVQEFQVRDSGLSADLGHATGGVINVVTKSGTNDWHGSAHWFVQSNSFFADNAVLVSTPAGMVPAPPPFDTRNQFGGTVGGPIVREKLFFFLAADLQEQAGPLGTNLAGDVSGVATPELPVATLADLEGATNQRQDLRTALFKLDYQISSGTRGTSRVNYTRNETDNFTGGRSQIFVPDAVSTNFENFVNEGPAFLQTITTVLNPTTVNEARFAYSLERRDRINNGDGPEVTITGVGSFGRRFFLPITNHHKRIQVVDNFSKTFGKHDLKLGVDLNSNGSSQAFIGFAGGVYQFASLANFVNAGVCPMPATRCPTSYRQLFGINGFGAIESGTLETFWQHERSVYIQDDWKIHPRVTLNLGLRWDGIWHPDPAFPILGDRVTLGRPRIRNGVLDQRVGPPPQGIPDDLDNVAPRIGVSWDATGDGKTIVRGGFGIYYGAPITIYMAPILSGMGFRGADTTISFSTATGMDTLGLGLTYPNTLPSDLDPTDPAAQAILNILPAPNIVFADPELESVRNMNFQAGIEREIAPNFSISGTYIHNRTENLRTGGFSSAPWDRTLDPNGVTFDSFGRTVGAFSIPRLSQSQVETFPGSGVMRDVIGGANALASFGRGRYHAFILQAKKAFSNRYQFNVNYTWSKNDDNATTDRDTDAFFPPSDPFNLDLDYGRSQLDISHQFRAFAYFLLPAKVEFSTIFNARSGRAFPVYRGFCAGPDPLNPFPNANYTDGFQCANFFLDQIRPAATGGGVVERFPFRNAGFFNWDVRFGRAWALGSERVKLRTTLELFNLTNRDNSFSNTTGFSINGVNCGGLSTEALCPFDVGAGPTARDVPTLPLSMQLGLKFIF